MHLYAFAGTYIRRLPQPAASCNDIIWKRGCQELFLGFCSSCPENDVHIVSTSNERLLNMNESLPQPLSSSPDRNINEI